MIWWYRPLCQFVTRVIIHHTVSIVPGLYAQLLLAFRQCGYSRAKYTIAYYFTRWSDRLIEIEWQTFRGDWKRGTGKRGTIIVIHGVENPRPAVMKCRSYKNSKKIRRAHFFVVFLLNSLSVLFLFPYFYYVVSPFILNVFYCTVLFLLHHQCGGIFNDSVIANFLLILTVKNFENRLIFDELKAHKKWCHFWATLYSHGENGVTRHSVSSVTCLLPANAPVSCALIVISSTFAMTVLSVAFMTHNKPTGKHFTRL